MLSAHTMQYLNQLGLITTFVEIDDNGVANAHKLIPTSGWYNGQKYPHDVNRELEHSTLKRLTKEGVEYYLVPDNSINARGMAAPYAQGVDTPAHKPRDAEAPPAVQKYLKSSKRKIQRIG